MIEHRVLADDDLRDRVREVPRAVAARRSVSTIDA